MKTKYAFRFRPVGCVIRQDGGREDGMAYPAGRRTAK